MQSKKRLNWLVRACLIFVVAFAAAGEAMSQSPDDKTFVGTKPGQNWESNGVKIKFCWCPPGKFMMGDPKRKPSKSNKGYIEVSIDRGFWLGKYEVTLGEWKKVIGPHPVKSERPFLPKNPRFPISFIYWVHARKFCEQLTNSERAGGRLPKGWEYRLPTEAQWEYSCRAGATTAYCFGDKTAMLRDYAWYGKINSDPYEVGKKKPNAWNLHDMHGNVKEWCRDVIKEEFAVPGTKGVYRGGSSSSEGKHCGCDARWIDEQRSGSLDLGFRVAIVQVKKKNKKQK